MRKLVIALSTAALGVGTLVAPLSADAAVVPAANLTAYTVDTQGQGSTPGDWAATTNTTGYSVQNGLAMQGWGPNSSTYSRTFLTFADGHPFAAGTVLLADSPDADHVGYSSTLPYTSCAGPVQGSLTIHAVTFDDQAAVTSFAGSSYVTCDGGVSYVAQEYRWASSVPLLRKVVAAGTWSPVETVTVTAPEAATYGPLALDGDAKGLVKLTANTCTGATVTVGATCSFGLSLYAQRLGGVQGVVSLKDSNAVAKDIVVPVTVVGKETKEGGYVGVAPARLLDTRKKVGVGTTTPLGAAKTLTLQVTGRGGVPSAGVRAAVINLTTVSPTRAGYLTAYPYGQSRPTASSINFGKGWTGANLITVPVGAGGKVSIYNNAGSTHVVADVMGYYTAFNYAQTNYSSYFDDAPYRAVDTRSDDWERTPLYPDEYLWQALDYGPDYSGRITAFAINLTVTKPTGNGYLGAWNGDDNTIPTTSSLNFTKGRTVPNMQVVPASQVYISSLGYSLPRFGVVNRSTGTAHVIVDVVGVYIDNGVTGGLRFKALPTPTRIIDTRKALGTTAIGAGVTKTVVAPPSVAGYNTLVLVANTTAVQPPLATVLTLWGNGHARPSVSNLNPYAGQLVSNMTMSTVGADNDFNIHNLYGTTNLVQDVAGTLEYYPAFLEPVGAKSGKPAPAPTATQLATTPQLTGKPAGGAHRGTLG